MEAPPKRKRLILYYYNGMPIREIAKVCGVFEGTVKSRLYHAKEQLKKVLTQEEGGKTWTILS
ncbi:MAG: RNA polymerase sigma factor [Pilosibacter sp.]